VCLGNICRSPAAEGVFRATVTRAGHADSIHIQSAGIIGYHTGASPDPRMSAAARRRGYLLGSSARQVTRRDLDSQDLIIAMDHENLRELEKLAGGKRSHIRLLGCYLGSGFDNPQTAPVPDPYYGGPEGFDTVLDMLEEASEAILQHCLEITGQLKSNGQ
jgi:protein-tyrosine phosphatase